MKKEGKSAWSVYRKLRRLAIFGAGLFALPFLWVPVVFPFGVWWHFSMVFLSFLSIWPLVFWKCPACGNHFFYRSPDLWQPWRKSCMHCRLPKWQKMHPKLPNISSVPPRSISPDLIITKRQKQRSFLTLVLRDDPGVISLNLDKDGWTEIDGLLAKARRNRIDLTTADLDDFLSGSSTGDFETDVTSKLIRFKRPV